MSDTNQASITTWNRIEPSSRDTTLSDPLQTQVRDPLWFLARQWQLGEFTGDDSGSPIQCSWSVVSAPLTGFRPGPGGTNVVPINASLPLETHAEREAVVLNLKGSVQMGLHFEQGLANATYPTGTSVSALISWFRQNPKYAIAPDPPEGEVADAAGPAYRLAVAGRVTDGLALYADPTATNPTKLATTIPTTPAVASVVAGVVNDLHAYFDSLYEVPAASDSTWDYKDLRYTFAAGVQSSLGSMSSVELDGSGSPGGTLDWFSFNLVSPAPDSFPSATATTQYFASVPSHVTFRGMPNSRWWTFDDGSSDLGQLVTNQTDLVKLLIMEFANVYGNDWFQLPVPLPVGTLSQVSTLIVTDTFGFTTLIETANSSGSAPNPWGMFVLSGPSARADLLFLAPTLSSVEESDPIEKVDFIKDDMAAMVWGVERTLFGPLDLGVPGYESYLLNIKANPRPPAPSPSTGNDVAYVLNTTVPYNWIPFVPQQQGNGGPLILRRGSMLEYDPTTKQTTWITPQGAILQPTGPAAVKTSGGVPTFNPMVLSPQAVPRVGATVQRTFRRARSTDGSTHVWIARRVDVGHGPGTAGLVYDEVVPTPGVSSTASVA